MKVIIFLNDRRQLHLVKVVGAVLHFHKFWDNFIMEIEDGTGQKRVVLPRSSCTECSGAVELRCKCTINSYVCVMGPRGAHCTASTSTAGRLRDGYVSHIWRVGGGMFDLIPT